MKVAIVYDRVNKWGGAERVLLYLHKIFPDAPLYTSVYNPETAKWAKVFPRIYTSFLQKFSFARKHHELFAVFMPLAFEQFNFDEYDLVVSVTSEFAKNIITKPNTKHICYCLTPTRYLWSGYNDYFRQSIFKFIAKPFVNYLKKVDRYAAKRPDVILSISNEVKKRVKKYYGRGSSVVFPPCNFVNRINKKFSDGKYFLLVSRLVPYKKVDLAVRAFNINRKPLVIVGTGSLEKSLKKMARGNIFFAGHVNEKDLRNYYKNCKALVFPQNEDFGLAAVEALCYGKPVIAFRAGGALDIVIDGKNGVFFSEQTVDSLNDAINRFAKFKFDHDIIVFTANKFSCEKFKLNFLRAVNK